MKADLQTKVRIIENLPGAGWNIRAEARIAAEALRVELERHAQAVQQIEERFAIEAWRHVVRNWTVQEIGALAAGLNIITDESR